MATPNHEDWVLMQSIAEGDESAIDTLYERFGTFVYRCVRQSLSNQAEAEDAVQEIFVRLWKTADRYDPTRAKLVTWVMLISKRHAIDRLRRKQVRPTNLSLEGDPAGRPGMAEEGGSSDGNDERRQLLVARIQELPALQQEVLTRAYLQGFTLREVAEQLEAPLGTIKSALSRGLARLRDRLAGDERLAEM
ncbi:MAG: sigma-70 family RNA polymerase sigma factor [Phycisphaera sp.]|nr:sigma-70 family RNA polymerase sigma factor [Phycisphaera sp.]